MRNFIITIVFILLPIFVSAQFGQDLYLGMRNNPEVVKLQEFLRSRGYFDHPTSTGNYFEVTLEAVKSFQKAQGIQPVSGYFGPRSRAAANRLLGTADSGGVLAVSTTSPHKGKITFAGVSYSSSKPDSESISIRNRTSGKTGEKISITGFTLENFRKEKFVIPKGHELPGFSPSPEDQIVLRPGDKATITVGKQERRMDFRKNLCVGYFQEFSQFKPSLSTSCPRPDEGSFLNLSDRCVKLIESTPRCRQPKITEYYEDSCTTFITEHLSYVGCVRDSRDRTDFYSSEWLIWMQRQDEFLKNSHDRLILKDPQGRVVDEYSY